MRQYNDIPGLEDIYLEDSWVEEIVCSPGQVAFVMNLVLTENHPEYRAPRVDEQYCYRRGQIVIRAVSSVTWNQQGTPAARDASDTVDFGNIDLFQWKSDRYVLEGDWGHMEVIAGRVEVQFQP